jgi:hypothetical protein
MATLIEYIETEDGSPGFSDDPVLMLVWPPPEIEQRLGLPQRFWHDLDAHGDWAFVVLLHTLLETLLTELLLAANPADPDVALWRTEQKRKEVARQQLLGGRAISFMTVFSEIRNYFAHDVRRVYAELGEHFVTRLSLEERKHLLRGSIKNRRRGHT